MPGDVVVGGSHYSMSYSSDRLLVMLDKLRGHGLDVWLFSPYGETATKAMVACLGRMVVSRDPYRRVSWVPPLLMAGGDLAGEFYKNMVSPAPARLDRLLRGEMERRNIGLSRTLLLDERFGRSLCLQGNRIVGWDTRLELLEKHIQRLSVNKGDLRRADKTFYPEDYDDERRDFVAQWAAEKAATLPADYRAQSPGQSLLCLDLDQTLICTDMVPISEAGRQQSAQMMSLFGYRTTAKDLESRERAHEYHLGDYGGWVRPGLLEMMAVAKKSFDRVCLYTAATKEYAAEILGQVLPEGLGPDFILARGETFAERISSPSQKTLLLPAAMGYDPARILMVDDIPSVYRFSRKNLIAIAAYHGSADDTALAELAAVLPMAARSRDIRVARFPRSLPAKPKKSK